jgi:hypothetical protein
MAEPGITPSPAFTPQSLAHAARRKAGRVQRKLQEAEADIRTANTVLTQPPEKMDEEDVREAADRNLAAEQKVHDATEELEDVKELLVHAAGEPAAAPGPGHNGDGVKSLLDKLTGRDA